jgi:hypothetical protein
MFTFDTVFAHYKGHALTPVASVTLLVTNFILAIVLFFTIAVLKAE